MSALKKIENSIKLFGMTNQLLNHDLDRIEKEYDIDLSQNQALSVEKDETYYPQFDKNVRKEASSMAQHYEIFYCLEKSIRSLIAEMMRDEEGPLWWDGSRVTPNIQQEVKKRIKREIDSGTTRRSDDELDYTNFGELGEIIKSNWDIFGSVFNSQKAVERVMNNLNTLRGPIAHYSLLAEDEIIRLQLSVRDWFRLME